MAKETTDYIKLPKKFKEKFLNALRSGEYKRAEGSLLEISSTGKEKYCCLGVACRLAEVGKKNLEGSSMPSELKMSLLSNLPITLNDDTPEKNGRINAAGHLAGLNDGGKTFKQIADWIERNL